MKEQIDNDNSQNPKLRSMTVRDYYHKRFKGVERISTGSKQLDNILLCGGIETQAVTEFYGDYGSALQVCHTLSAMVPQDNSQGGLCGKSIYLDTTGNFRHERIIEIAKVRGFDPDMTLDNIILEEALYSSEEQEQIVENIGQYFISQNGNGSNNVNNLKKTKLLIVDSPVNHYRAEYIERKELPKRQKKLYRFMSNLKKIAYRYGIAVVVTNHVHTVPNRYLSSDTSDSKEPVGGNVMMQTITYGVNLKRKYGQDGYQRIEYYTAEILFSTYHQRRRVDFGITDRGVVDFVHPLPPPSPPD
jgi:DNA repair protein RadA